MKFEVCSKHDALKNECLICMAETADNAIRRIIREIESHMIVHLTSFEIEEKKWNAFKEKYKVI